ncbi:hypothetical protein [Corallincola spongiicola]|uniref:Orphan protein secreted protein n=1 Tax=Corallincola spongiicola TaxID=2520508 RepID=A0ABY1WMM3_9GAMM|nr:hypothetical protein [Corallincola spongiicola]TAA43657.1 hypothetical protein EXY25_13970 [Corallincola spongiicola]
MPIKNLQTASLFALSLLALLSQVAFATPASQCSILSQQLSAHYQIDMTGHGKKQTTAFWLWRDGNKVAHQYPATQITEQWDLLGNNWIKPTRFFDHYQRAIEYQPGEKVHGKQEQDWPHRYQLISAQQLEKFTLKSERGEGCDKRQTLELNSNNEKTTLVWLPQLQLIHSLQRHYGNKQEQWQLVTLAHDRKTINTFFAVRQNYQATDYADIGDDHTDPFLTQMVTQGFIEGGASGFYDTQGNALAGHEHHH